MPLDELLRCKRRAEIGIVFAHQIHHRTTKRGTMSCQRAERDRSLSLCTDSEPFINALLVSTTPDISWSAINLESHVQFQALAIIDSRLKLSRLSAEDKLPFRAVIQSRSSVPSQES